MPMSGLNSWILINLASKILTHFLWVAINRLLISGNGGARAERSDP